MPKLATIHNPAGPPRRYYQQYSLQGNTTSAMIQRILKHRSQLFPFHHTQHGDETRVASFFTCPSILRHIRLQTQPPKPAKDGAFRPRLSPQPTPRLGRPSRSAGPKGAVAPSSSLRPRRHTARAAGRSGDGTGGATQTASTSCPRVCGRAQNLLLWVGGSGRLLRAVCAGVRLAWRRRLRFCREETYI